jgi:hypothetical protein
MSSLSQAGVVNGATINLMVMIFLLVIIEGLLFFKNLSYILGEYSLHFRVSYT